jgi:hypothetical protein
LFYFHAFSGASPHLKAAVFSPWQAWALDQLISNILAQRKKQREMSPLSPAIRARTTEESIIRAPHE